MDNVLLSEAIRVWFVHHGANLKDAANLRSVVINLGRVSPGDAMIPPTTKDIATIASGLSGVLYHGPATVKKHLSVLRRALNWYRDYTGGEWSLPRFPRLQGSKPKLRTLSDAEVTFLRMNVTFHARDLFEVLLGTGLRLQEALALKVDDLSGNRLTVYRPKTETTTVLPVGSRVVRIISSPLCERVFPEAVQASAVSGLRKALASLNAAFTEHTARYGKATIHSIRHTYATNLLAQGLPLADISYLLGHTNIQQTAQYAHVTRGSAVERAAALLEE